MEAEVGWAGKSEVAEKEEPNVKDGVEEFCKKGRRGWVPGLRLAHVRGLEESQV